MAGPPPPPPGYVLDTPQGPHQSDPWGQFARGFGRTALSGLQTAADVGTQWARPDVMLNKAADATDQIAGLLQSAFGNGQKPPAPPPGPRQAPAPANTPQAVFQAAGPNRGVGQSTLQADTDALATLAQNAVRRRRGEDLKPTKSNFGPTSSERAAQLPFLNEAPQTSGERLASDVGGMAAMGPLAKTPLQAALITALGGGGQWGAGEAARGVGLGPEETSLAETGGGIIGGGLGGAIGGGPRPQARMAANATPPMSREMQAGVVANMRRAPPQGPQPTLPEAVDYTVPGARLGTLARSAEVTPEGVAVLGPRYRARPAQTNAAVTAILDALGREREPGELGSGVQRAAEAQLKGLESQRTAAVNADYKAAGPRTVDPAAMAQILDDMAAQSKADKTGLLSPMLDQARGWLTEQPPTPEGGQTPPRQPILDIENIDRVRKEMRDRGELPPGTDRALTREQSGVAGDYVSRLSELLSQDPNFQRGNQTYQDMSRALVDPAQAGQLGGLSRTTNLPEQGNLAYPAQPMGGAPAETARTMGQLGPEGADLSRAYLSQQLAEALHNRDGLPNTRAPSAFSQAVAGNPTQRENLLAGTGASNPSVAANLGNALDVFDMMGTRKPEGSTTAGNLRGDADVMSGGKALSGAATGGSLRLVTDRMLGWVRNMQIEMNQKGIVDLVNSNPERAASYLQEIEAARGNTIQQRALVGAFIGAQGANANKGN